jgi:protein SEY1
LRAKIDEQTADTAILTKLRAYFEERFRYDEHGVPCVWKPGDDIDGAFKKAKDATLELISLYSKITPEDPEFEYTPPEDDEGGALGLVVFSETKALELGARFRREADAYYVEAKRSTVASIAQVPYWIYGLLVLLGWNEAMMILFNPLYFTMMLILAAGS